MKIHFTQNGQYYCADHLPGANIPDGAVEITEDKYNEGLKTEKLPLKKVKKQNPKTEKFSN